MGKNQAYKAMQRSRLSGSADAEEVEDGMVPSNSKQKNSDKTNKGLKLNRWFDGLGTASMEASSIGKWKLKQKRH
ncbi:hypothetical protein KSP40_PGU001518 [Platanthera guangdongensis]|uniref:Uncharacterized protein n=1 Tax=Platanthera guangdongensis TaxID=2320717 RepID=A0ABR2M4E6_9ASPA